MKMKSLFNWFKQELQGLLPTNIRSYPFVFPMRETGYVRARGLKDAEERFKTIWDDKFPKNDYVVSEVEQVPPKQEAEMEAWLWSDEER